MKRYHLLAAFMIVFLTGIVWKGSTYKKDEVPYPEDYRMWTHVKTGIVKPDNEAFPRFRGIHHIYANDKAMQGFSMEQFPDGSVFVFDLLGLIDDGKGNITEGKRKFIDVMLKDSIKFDSTGGWGFEEFESDDITKGSLGRLGKQGCFNCHKTRKKNDFVFSDFRK